MTDAALRLAEPRTPDPTTAPPLRWGVVGTGWIAERFVAALHTGTAQRVVAVGSRSQGGAERFAAAIGGARAHGSYDELVADPEVDVIYVATPHPAHAACARLAIAAGKHVLVEKPMALDADQAGELVGLARDRGVLLVEAMWSMSLPRFDVVRQALDGGLLGRVHTVLADHGEWFDGSHRIMEPALAGGPMLDLGTYPVALATWALGPSRAVRAVGRRIPAGVHGQIAAVTEHRDDAQGVLHMTILSSTPTAATIAGDAGSIDLPGPFYMPGDVVLRDRHGVEADR